jgi:hypothetical protein
MRRRIGLGGFLGAAIILLVWIGAAMASTTTPVRTAQHQVRQAESEHYSLCQLKPSLCVDPVDSIGPGGEYTGHDEPSVLFQSRRPGTAKRMTYTFTLPKNPPVRPRQNGSGGTWNFELRSTNWFGLALCDSQSAPEFRKTCATSDANHRFTSANPRSPNYIGKAPGGAYMELQFYYPSYVEQFTGFGCTAHQYCAAMTIDSLNQNMNTDTPNNADCLNNYFLVGPEPINWAYVTRSGNSQAPANPIAASTDPNLTAVTPDPSKDLMMNPGDRIRVHIHDTPAGIRADLTDLTTHRHGSMTASIGNGFGQVLFQPKAATCHVRPYAFHPLYSTATPGARGVVWSAHTYNVAQSDEIGHFELCNAVDKNGNCTSPGPQDPALDADDTFCLPGSLSTLIKITSCGQVDNDFDGIAYQAKRWPGSVPNRARDRRLHPTPVTFTSPMSGGKQYEKVSFEADLPRIEAADLGGTCDRQTGQNCVNPPPGAQFYPIYVAHTTEHHCVWQEGGKFLSGNDFGGTSKTEYGPLLRTLYPGPGSNPGPHFRPLFLINNYRRNLNQNPCPS